MQKRDDQALKAPVPCWFCGELISVAQILRNGILRSREVERGGPQRIVICPSCLRENLCEMTRKGRWFSSPNVSLGILDILFSQLPGAATEEVLQAISWYRANETRRRIYFEIDGDDRYAEHGMSFLKKLWPWWSAAGSAGGTASTGSRRDAPRQSAGSSARAGWTNRPGAGADSTAGPRPGARDGPRAGPRTGPRAGPQGGPRTGAQGGARNGPRPGGRAGPRPGSGASDGARSKPPPASPPRPELVTPHEVLGVPEGASADEVRRAFHRLAVQFHPDKVHHLGEEFQAMAHIKFQELMRAYEALQGRH